jgi:AcrR family transcriptional regulator
MSATSPSSRAARERELVAAARRLFDERGVQEAQIEDIARAVGINKALIYRVVGSKEELFVLTLTSYMDELLERAVDRSDLSDPERLLRESCRIYARFILEHPAFLDCALSLMRGSAADLERRVGEATWTRLGEAMAAALDPLVIILRAGREQGVFAIDDPDLVANRIYTQALGTMHLARVAAGVRRDAAGVAEVFAIDPEQIAEACAEDAMVLARVR